MSAYRQQAHLDAPIETVWELVGNPDRHPEWWPRVVEVRGERFDEGDDYAQVTRGLVGREETLFLVERRTELREIHHALQEDGGVHAVASDRGARRHLRRSRDGHGSKGDLGSRVRRDRRPRLLSPLDQSVDALQRAAAELRVTQAG